MRRSLKEILLSVTQAGSSRKQMRRDPTDSVKHTFEPPDAARGAVRERGGWVGAAGAPGAVHVPSAVSAGKPGDAQGGAARPAG